MDNKNNLTSKKMVGNITVTYLFIILLDFMYGEFDSIGCVLNIDKILHVRTVAFLNKLLIWNTHIP